MPTLVVIPENTPSGRQIFKSLVDQGEMPLIFPGWPLIPRGIQGKLEESREVIDAVPEGKIAVRLSNGQTRIVPKEHVRIIQ